MPYRILPPDPRPCRLNRLVSRNLHLKSKVGGIWTVEFSFLFSSCINCCCNSVIPQYSSNILLFKGLFTNYILIFWRCVRSQIGGIFGCWTHLDHCQNSIFKIAQLKGYYESKTPFFSKSILLGIICLWFYFEKHNDVMILTLILGPIPKRVNLVHHSSLLRTQLGI